MRTKRMVALGLSGILALGGLAACGNSETTDSASTETVAAQESVQAGSTGTESIETTEGSGEAGAYNVDWEDMADINVVFIAPGAIPPGLQEVEDAVNEITEPQINTHVNLEMLEMGNYIQQVSLMMTSNEPVDLVMTFPAGSATFSSMQTQNQLMDITDLLESYGQPLLDIVGEYIKATTIDGRIYGVPVYRDYSSRTYAVMRTDVIEDLGLEEEVQQMTSLADLEKILEAVKSSEKWSYLAGLAPAAGNGSIAFLNGCYIKQDAEGENIYYDTLGSDIVSVDPTGENPEVQLIASLPEYKELYETMNRWYESGYIYKDSATDKGAGPELVKSDKLFGMLMNGELGMEATMTQSCQMPMTCVSLLPVPVTTQICTMFSWGIPNASKNPEAAVTFLSMLYTSSDLNNLLAWGIKGRDYVIKDGFAQYPDGVVEVPYHSSDYITGNQFLVTPWIGQDADIREQAQAALEEAQTSAYLGFTCNTEPISNELSAVNNVVAEFGPQINSGVAGSEVLENYIQKLQDVNVQKVIDEYQKQLDEWIANNK